MKNSGNTILVTGGGSGIGQALAWRLHDAGNTVIVAGRRVDALAQTTAGRANLHAIALDVDDPAALAAFARDIVARFPALNVLVNNAGIMTSEDLTRHGDLAAAERIVTTNILGPIRLTNALIDHLVARGDGVVINVTSGLASVPLATAPTYSASKAAIHSWTQSLRHQLRGRVEVLELAPPGVQTDLTPGQSTREGYMPLDAYADEVMSILARTPIPDEVLVERVKFLRHAEREGRFDQAFAALNPSPG